MSFSFCGVHLWISRRMPEITVPGGLKPLPKGESSKRPARSLGQRAFPEIGRELGVPLPAQRALAPLHRIVARLPVGRRNALPARQFGKHRMVDAAAGLGHEGELDEDARRLDQWIAGAHAPRRWRLDGSRGPEDPSRSRSAPTRIQFWAARLSTACSKASPSWPPSQMVMTLAETPIPCGTLSRRQRRICCSAQARTAVP